MEILVPVGIFVLGIIISLVGGVLAFNVLLKDVDFRRRSAWAHSGLYRSLQGFSTRLP